MGDRIRMTATAEFSGYDTSHTPADFRTALEVAETLFPGAGDIPRASYWGGLGPMTPEGWPRIGRVPSCNFSLTAGYGHMGWTTLPDSPRVVADLTIVRHPRFDLTGFSALW